VHQSHVMTCLRLVLRLLPDVPVALCLVSVVPRHDLPPSRTALTSRRTRRTVSC
jgi:hypothetical protein